MDDRPQYRHFFRCRGCGDRFSVLRLTADPAKVKTPKCPKKRCTARVRVSHQEDIGFDAAEGKAPAQVGAIAVKAFDQTMEMTMADHGMTDIKDNARPGESSVPALRPDLQRQADSFWGSGQKRQAGTRRGRVDLSGMYGERATNAPKVNGQPAAMKFDAGQGSAIEPILRSRPTGSSPVPAFIDVATPKS